MIAERIPPDIARGLIGVFVIVATWRPKSARNMKKKTSTVSIVGYHEHTRGTPLFEVKAVSPGVALHAAVVHHVAAAAQEELPDDLVDGLPLPFPSLLPFSTFTISVL